MLCVGSDFDSPKGGARMETMLYGYIYIYISDDKGCRVDCSLIEFLILELELIVLQGISDSMQKYLK